MIRRIRPAVALLALALLGTLCASSLSAEVPQRGPKLDAKSWIVIDARTGEPLAGRAVNRRLAMASTTKMMTAYLAARNLAFNETVVAGDYNGDPAESLMGLEPGQVVSVRDLLYGLMMLSGNDAAVTLAEAVSGSEQRFVALMNQTARSLGLTNTHYENPIGLDGDAHYTSAADLATLGRVIMSMPRLRKIAGARVAKLTSYNPPLTIETTDSFLVENPWARGIKTGHTLSSGYTLASDGRRKATELIGALIGAPTEAARNDETERLLGWGFSLYEKRVPVRTARPVETLPVRFEDQGLPVNSKRRVRVGVRDDERLTLVTNLPDEVEGPIAAGEKLGTATVLIDGRLFDRVRLFAGRTVEEPSLTDRALANPLWIAGSLALLLFAILSIILLVRSRRQRRARRKLQRVFRTRR